MAVFFLVILIPQHNTFTEIETNLNAVENDVIIDLAILNDKAYVIQGNPVDSRDSYTIMSAEIEF